MSYIKSITGEIKTILDSKLGAYVKAKKEERKKRGSEESGSITVISNLGLH